MSLFLDSKCWNRKIRDWRRWGRNRKIEAEIITKIIQVKIMVHSSNGFLEKWQHFNKNWFHRWAAGPQVLTSHGRQLSYSSLPWSSCPSFLPSLPVASKFMGSSAPPDPYSNTSVTQGPVLQYCHCPFTSLKANPHSPALSSEPQSRISTPTGQTALPAQPVPRFQSGWLWAYHYSSQARCSLPQARSLSIIAYLPSP